jgi:hypothetical protein
VGQVTPIDVLKMPSGTGTDEADRIYIRLGPAQARACRSSCALRVQHHVRELALARGGHRSGSKKTSSQTRTVGATRAPTFAVSAAVTSVAASPGADRRREEAARSIRAAEAHKRRARTNAEGDDDCD